MKFVQGGRRLLTSLARYDIPCRTPPINFPSRTPPPSNFPPGRPHPLCRHCQPRKPWPPVSMLDPFDRPLPPPIVYETIECMKRLHPRDIEKFRYVFSDLLGLPKPPSKVETEETGDKFAVKLISFDEAQSMKLLRELAWIKWTEEVKSMSDLGMRPLIGIIDSTPSVIKQGVSKEEANDIIAKVESAGGVAVMEPLE